MITKVQTKKILKPEYQQRVDIVTAKPYKLERVWDWDSEKDTWKEDTICRSSSINGIKSFARLNNIPKGTGEYRIIHETIEFFDGFYPSYEEELIEEY